MQQVYLDNAATTPMRQAVIDRMVEVMTQQFGNASSTHSFGRSSKSLLETSRKIIAKLLNATPSEIVFTSGGTEGDNFVLRSAVRDLGVTHLITSKIEHHAVLHTVEALEREYNIKVSYVNLKADGAIALEHLEVLLQTKAKTLVSLMHVNNEVGNILNIEEVARLCKLYHALFHTDAVQAVGHLPIDLQTMGVDFLVASAHKFHGPKGVGFLYARKHTGLKGSVFGGEQERGFRAGTEALHNIAGMETALVLAYKNLEAEKNHITALKQYFINGVKRIFPEACFNGQSGTFDKSTYNLVNVGFPLAKEQGALLQFQLDLKGIACSKGSACQSGSSQGSHVLTAISSNSNTDKPSIRFSFSIFNTEQELDYVLEVLKTFAR